MRYIEPIKSIVLFILVLLSIYLTFLIWNYQPDYKPIEESSIEESSIEHTTLGQQKDIKYVLKPYRMLFRHDDKYTGTVSSVEIDQMMSLLSNLHAEDLRIVNTDLSISKVNEMTRINERMTMFFKTEIPLQAFSNVLVFEEKELPEATFNRLIIDWSHVETAKKAQILFVSMGNETVYSTDVIISDKAKFKEIFSNQLHNYATYKEVERGKLLSLYVPEEKPEIKQYTYLIDDISHGPFKEILFPDAGLVEENIDNAFVEYTDGMSLMTFDSDTKIMAYVNLVAESESLAPISRSRLVLDTYKFINDHGGFTADYRLSAMNTKKHVTEYQMYIKGLPVYSTSTTTTTRISTTWGENQIFRYRRPYFSLDNAIHETPVDIVAGADVIELLQNHPQIDYKEVDDIVLGYYLDFSKDSLTQNTQLFILEPNWFAISDNNWEQILPGRNGGDEYGLE